MGIRDKDKFRARALILIGQLRGYLDVLKGSADLIPALVKPTCAELEILAKNANARGKVEEFLTHAAAYAGTGDANGHTLEQHHVWALGALAALEGPMCFGFMSNEHEEDEEVWEHKMKLLNEAETAMPEESHVYDDLSLESKGGWEMCGCYTIPEGEQRGAGGAVLFFKRRRRR